MADVMQGAAPVGQVRGILERGEQVADDRRRHDFGVRNERSDPQPGVGQCNAAELVDARIYSSELPYMKPHASAFEAALAAVGVTDPTRAVFVGDRPATEEELADYDGAWRRFEVA